MCVVVVKTNVNIEKYIFGVYIYITSNLD